MVNDYKGLNLSYKMLSALQPEDSVLQARYSSWAYSKGLINIGLEAAMRDVTIQLRSTPEYDSKDASVNRYAYIEPEIFRRGLLHLTSNFDILLIALAKTVLDMNQYDNNLKKLLREVCNFKLHNSFFKENPNLTTTISKKSIKKSVSVANLTKLLLQCISEQNIIKNNLLLNNQSGGDNNNNNNNNNIMWVNATNLNGYLPLHHAVAIGDIELVKQILPFYEENFLKFNSTTDSGFTPIHIAVVKGINTGKMVNTLIESGFFNPAELDRHNRTAAYIAKMKGENLCSTSLAVEEECSSSTADYGMKKKLKPIVDSYIINDDGEELGMDIKR